MYYEGLVNITKKVKDGADQIKQMMTDFRQSPPKTLAGSPVAEVKDFQEQTSLVILRTRSL